MARHGHIGYLINNAPPLMKGIDTVYTKYEGPDALQQPVGRVGNPLDIANMVLFLCSDKAGFITGENITIDGGMTKLMIYHNTNGWKLNA